MPRPLLASLLAALLVGGCDSGTAPPPDPDPLGVTVEYRVSATGAVFDPAVSYTEADGTTAEVTAVTLSTGYTQTIDLAPGATGTFRLSARGLVDAGVRINVSVIAAETGDPSNVVASATDVAVSSVDATEVTAAAEVTVPILLPPAEDE